MKRTKIIGIVFIIVMLFNVKVYANNEQVQINGNSTVKPEEEQTITVELNCNEKIGVIEGILSFDSSIENVKISPGYNGWTATYNSATGKFNAFNAEGTDKGEVLQIKYNLKNNSTTGTINIKNIELTTISYNTIKIEDNISKIITKSNETNQNINNNENTQNLQNTNYISGSTIENDIPKTGQIYLMIIIPIIILSICAVFLYKKNKKYKDI